MPYKEKESRNQRQKERRHDAPTPMIPLNDAPKLNKFLAKNNVGGKSGQHPFYGMRSVIFTPSKPYAQPGAVRPPEKLYNPPVHREGDEVRIIKDGKTQIVTIPKPGVRIMFAEKEKDK